jgi:hypothetical protein
LILGPNLKLRSLPSSIRKKNNELAKTKQANSYTIKTNKESNKKGKNAEQTASSSNETQTMVQEGSAELIITEKGFIKQFIKRLSSKSTKRIIKNEQP